MDSFKQFSTEKREVISRLDQIRNVLSEIGELGLDVTPDLNKIEKTIGDVESDMLRIALLGAFSDGKTSVIAGWLGRVMTNMKIDTDESSDRLSIYHPEDLPERCEIVDTPGLFGDKERSDDNGQTIQFGDITKNYLSQAHLIFYVVDATNPLKESHKDLVRWILRDLNKLENTIFVINKMDEVADLRSPTEFAAQADIKKTNLLDKLDRFLSLSPAERAAINVICIAANPNNRGLDFWFERMTMYEERSRINELKTITSEVLSTTARGALIRKTGLDVISDVVQTKISAAEVEVARFAVTTSELSKDIGLIEDDIKLGRRRILAAKANLVLELENMENRLMAMIRTVDRAGIVPFLEDEFGYASDDIGYKLRLKIEILCQRSFEHTAALLDGITVKIDRQLESSANFADAIAGTVLGHAKSGMDSFSALPSSMIRDGVLVGRDLLKSATGISIKFKPWGALKLAGTMQDLAGPIGAALQIIGEVVGVVQQVRAEQELAGIKNELKEIVKLHFKQIYDILGDDNKTLEAFAPQLKIFEAVLKQQREALAILGAKQKALERLKEKFHDAIEPGP